MVENEEWRLRSSLYYLELWTLAWMHVMLHARPCDLYIGTVIQYTFRSICRTVVTLSIRPWTATPDSVSRPTHFRKLCASRVMPSSEFPAFLGQQKCIRQSFLDQRTRHYAPMLTTQYL